MHVQHRSWSHVFYRWDSQWYESVATHGYNYVVQDHGRTLSNEAFFPLFPYLEKLISNITSLPYIDGGIAISISAGVVAALMIYKSVFLVSNKKVALITVALWALLPISFVQILSYSETLFTALCASALYFSIRKNFLVAVCFASFAGLTRPSGLAVSIAVMAAAFIYLRKQRRSRQDPATIIAIFLAPVGWLSFVGYLALKHHDMFAYFKIQRNWGNGFDGGANFLGWIGNKFSTSPLIGILIALGVLVVIFLLIAAIKRQQPIEFIIFSSIIVFLSFTTAGYFGSKPRYLMPAYPLLVPIGQWLMSSSNFKRILTLTILGIVGLTTSVLTLAGNGPP